MHDSLTATFLVTLYTWEVFIRMHYTLAFVLHKDNLNTCDPFKLYSMIL